MAAAGNQAGGGAAAAGRLQAVAKMVPQAVPAGGGTVGQAVVRHLQAVEQVAAQQGQVAACQLRVVEQEVFAAATGG